MFFDSTTPDAVARKLLLPAAELGLLYRPVHLLIGKLPWGDSVSPYTRDLTITLDQFAESGANSSLPISTKPQDVSGQEDWYYAVAEIFVGQVAERLTEKVYIEKSVGIHRLGSSTEQSLWIDSKRIDWPAADSRLQHLASNLTSPHPVWLILNPQLFSEPEALILTIVSKLQAHLSSLTLSENIDPAYWQTLKAQAPQTHFYQDEPAHGDARDYHQAATTLARTILGDSPPKRDSETAPKKTGPAFRIKA